MSDAGKPGRHSRGPEWYRALKRFEQPDNRLAIRQLANTVIPLLGLYALMLYTVLRGYPYGITLGLSVVTAGFLVRTFIFLHDGSHGSFFTSPRANAVLGFLIGVLTLTSYGQWRWSHLAHHGAFGNLDRRGVGDIQLMTVEEYRAAPRWSRWAYRIYRHPLIMFGLGSTLLFALIYRLPTRGAPPDARRSAWLTDIAILAVAAVAGFAIGLRPWLLVVGPVWVIAWTAGVWLFYVQHQFAGVYWARQAEWDFFRAALEGSSYYRLPPALQWITGNIGLHHLHHLRPRIPNYRLQQAYDATPAVQAVTPLTPRGSLASLRLNLYDEDRRQLVSFHDLPR